MAQEKRDDIFRLGILFLILSLIIITSGYFFVHKTFTLEEFVQDFYANIGAEIGSIAITIIIVDRIVKNQEEKELEKQIRYKLLVDIHSTENSVANNAVHELRALGKLTGSDAWTASANLSGRANLVNARLYDANFNGTKLIGANLYKADLRNVDFRNADLTGVNLAKADLTGAKFNNDTILPNGNNWQFESDLINSSVLINEKELDYNWLKYIDLTKISVDNDMILKLNVTLKNLIYYLRKKYSGIEIAENELHLFRHWYALSEYHYETIGEIEELLERTEEARNWIWDGSIPNFSILYISYAIALENVNHLILPHWNQKTKERITEARARFYGLAND